MSKELVISSNRHETRVAILEDDQLVEIYFQRANEYSLAGSIHKGRVTRVLPGMQSAFVDLGLERDTFLYVSDFFEENGEDFDSVDPKPARQERSSGRRDAMRHDAPKVDAIKYDAPVPPVLEEELIPEEAADEPALPPTLFAATEAITEDSAAPLPAQSSAGMQQQDRGGDRRGRRGRRRRTRAKGFPESKYASDLDAAPAASEPASISAAQDEEEAEDAAEVFLLPGESLAKYRGRPASDPSDPSEVDEADPVEEQPDDPDSPVAQDDEIVEAGADVSLAAERFEAGQVETAQPEFEPATPVSEPEPAVEVAPEPASETHEEVAGSAFPDASYVSIPTLSASVESESAAAIDTDTDSDSQTDSNADSDPEPEPDDEPSIEEPPSDTEEAPIEEPTDAPPMQASIREQGGNKYQHRSSRRMRRRGRGGDRGDRTTEPRPAERPEKPPEERPTPMDRPPAMDRPAAVDRVAGGSERSGRPERFAPRGGGAPAQDQDDRKSPLPSITDLLKEGQEIIVQIAKEPLGQKGARITSHIALPGRYVVYMPTLEHLGVSRKIASDEERLRLKRILQTHRQGITGGFIVRTAGEGHTEEEIAADMLYLYNLWLDMRQKAEKKPAPVLLHHDLEIVQRILRDQLSDMYKTIWCDNEDVYESTVRFMQRFQPSLVGRVKMYTRSAPIFDAFGISSEIEKALRPKVWLKSGGYIVINQTEALVAIDVNTGKYVGKSNRLEDTITKTNTEAVKEIVRQIRLRDLGGIIVVDFIDMDERKNRQKVMQTLEEAMRADRAPY
ncbi:MAG TPA: Rne/Rng family ribonuclease, partial [Bryobacteraceae bacterium]|nr:Rne/Rng family ribonuclease [Bryobacteraceae bacterium]